MKYTRLTKEQFDELHREFAQFLALQSIDRHEWEEIKSLRLHVAEQELDVFSELIWEKVLSRTAYVDNISVNHWFLFHVTDSHIHSIIVRNFKPDLDISEPEGRDYLLAHLSEPFFEILTGRKSFSDRNAEVFQLIRSGGEISDGSLYRAILSCIPA